MRINGGCEFSDGTVLSWDMRQPVAKAHLYGSGGKSGRLTDAHWACTVLDNTGGQVEELEVPVSRYREYVEHIPVPKEKISVRELLTQLHSFYHNSELRLGDLQGMTAATDMFGYIANAKERARQGKPVHPIDLLGELVHYEGLRIHGNIAGLSLGS